MLPEGAIYKIGIESDKVGNPFCINMVHCFTMVKVTGRKSDNYRFFDTKPNFGSLFYTLVLLIISIMIHLVASRQIYTQVNLYVVHVHAPCTTRSSFWLKVVKDTSLKGIYPTITLFCYPI